MRLEKLQSDAVRDLPAWRDARWTPLHGGLTNRTWRLQQDGREAVIKIDDAPRSAPYGSRAEEAEMQSAAARAGLANAVLYADSRVYLTEYASGRVWDGTFFDEEGNLEQLALALKELHALPPSGRRFDAAGAARIYAERIKAPQASLAGQCIGIVEATPRPDEVCFCHNDLVAENIISTPAIRFLDWEYAADNEPMFDLATIIEHHALDAAQAETLLEVYAAGNSAALHARLAAQRRLYLALWWLWLASRAENSAGQPGDLDKIGRRLATSCS
ncbi:MAG: phosphotransferase [Gammaproteobacteria bacterium]|nr:phosphotransferase [Gammaproteobacteria bacterium]